MATATIQIDTAGSGTMTRQRTITGAHLVRFVAALRVAYGTPVELTDIEVLEMWADRVFDQARDLTRVTEKRVAADGITDISLT